MAAAISLEGGSLAAFQAAAWECGRLSATLGTAGEGIKRAMVVRTAAAATDASSDAVTRCMSPGGPRAGQLARLLAAFDALEPGSGRSSPAATFVSAATAGGAIVVSAGGGADVIPAFALASATVLVGDGVLPAAVAVPARLDAAARAAAVQVDRSAAWGEWIRAWCVLFAREAAAASRDIAFAAERFLEERAEVRKRPRVGATDAAVLEWLQAHPALVIRDAADGLGITAPTVGTAVARLEAAGLAVELTGQQRDRAWASPTILSLADPTLRT